MTEQSPNDAFHATSFLQGRNVKYIKQLHACYANNPDTVNAGFGDAVLQATG